MKVIHIESGLGNQMLSYCEYLAIKKVNGNEQCFVETIVYDIPECNDVICQWNGYELERIFGINAPDIKQVCNNEQWKEIMKEIKKSGFWNKNWNYPVYFVQAFNKGGFKLINYRGDFEGKIFLKKHSTRRTIKKALLDSKIGNITKRIYRYIRKNKYLKEVEETELLFLKSTDDIFTGQRLSFKFIGNNIELIDKEIRKTFKFPKIIDKKNLEILNIIRESNSVAIHARRGDMLGYNSDCYKYGYFKRAVKYIKSNVENPVFIFFCDPGSVEWCKNNYSIFGLNFNKDKVLFTDWNKGENSFRDMQLMAECKHAIITNSSFGWWGAYLNNNHNKITCSPDITINTTHHF